jgi:hypothetical protein
MKEYIASELKALSPLGWNMNDIAIILDLPLKTVKKETIRIQLSYTVANSSNLELVLK